MVSGGRDSSLKELAGLRLLDRLGSVVEVPRLFLIPPSVVAMCALAHFPTLLILSASPSGRRFTFTIEAPLLRDTMSMVVLARAMDGFSDWPYTASRNEVSAMLRSSRMSPTLRLSRVESSLYCTASCSVPDPRGGRAQKVTLNHQQQRFHRDSFDIRLFE
jgi:hypothetical protein